jgi:hypothetical protein
MVHRLARSNRLLCGRALDGRAANHEDNAAVSADRADDNRAADAGGDHRTIRPVPAVAGTGPVLHPAGDTVNDEWMANEEAYQQEMLGYERQRAAIRQTVGGALTGMVILGLAFCLGIPLLFFEGIEEREGRQR